MVVAGVKFVGVKKQALTRIGSLANVERGKILAVFAIPVEGVLSGHLHIGDSVFCGVHIGLHLRDERLAARHAVE
jgi:hypothetical protein